MSFFPEGFSTDREESAPDLLLFLSGDRNLLSDPPSFSLVPSFSLPDPLSLWRLSSAETGRGLFFSGISSGDKAEPALFPDAAADFPADLSLFSLTSAPLSPVLSLFSFLPLLSSSSFIFSLMEPFSPSLSFSVCRESSLWLFLKAFSSDFSFSLSLFLLFSRSLLFS